MVGCYINVMVFWTYSRNLDVGVPLVIKLLSLIVYGCDNLSIFNAFLLTFIVFCPCFVFFTIVAVLLQKQTSTIVTLKSSGLDRPAKLDGKVYASYAARYEGRIVQKLIQADGGSGDYKEVPHPFLKV